MSELDDGKKCCAQAVKSVRDTPANTQRMLRVLWCERAIPYDNGNCAKANAPAPYTEDFCMKSRLFMLR